MVRAPRRVAGRAFRDAYGVEVEPVRPDNPLFAAGLIEAERAASDVD